jgi:hypothetical protein
MNPKHMNPGPSVEAVQLADLLLHRCGPREVAYKDASGKAMWRCWTCGSTRHVLAGSDTSAWFHDLALRAKRTEEPYR